MQKIYTQKEIDRWESTNDPRMGLLLYKNIPGIRRSDINIRITEDEMVTLHRYSRNLIDFIHNYGIVYPGGNKCKPVLNENQERILKNQGVKRFYTVSVPRQSGLSSIIQFMALRDVIFKGSDVVIMCPRMENSIRIIKMIMEMYAELPFYMKPGVDNMKNTSVKFENGGRLTACSSDKPMGRNVDSLFIDDFQYLDRKSRESIFRTWLPVMSSLTSNNIFIGATGQIPEELRGIGEFAMFICDDVNWITIRNKGISTFYQD